MLSFLLRIYTSVVYKLHQRHIDFFSVDGATGMLNSHPQEFKEAAESFVRVIRDDVCKPCVEAGQNHEEVDLDNPLGCGCVCDKVKALLDTAKTYLEMAKE